MIRGFFNAVTGMDSSRFWIDVTSDNLANVNTIGFKAQRPLFQDVISSVTVGLNTVTGTLKSTTYGAGSVVDSTQKIWTIGNFKQTGINTDLAIQGRGLFILDDPVTQNRYYTRDGQFRISRDGFMVNSAGLKLQGFRVDEQGNTIGTSPEDIKIETQLPPQATNEIRFLQPTNLNADAQTKTAYTPGTDSNSNGIEDIYENPDIYNYRYTVTIYDSLGQEYAGDFFFIKTNTNEWQILFLADIDGDGVSDIQGNWTVTFDPAGSPIDDSGDDVLSETVGNKLMFYLDPSKLTQPYSGGTTTPGGGEFPSASDWRIYIGEADTSFATDNGDPITNSYLNQYSGDFVVTMEQNGYTKGDLIDVFVLSEDGAVVGVYSNGKSKPLYRVAIALFTDTEELIKKGANLYTSITTPTILVPGGSEKIRSGMLEMSNVDIAKEFINLITAQRAYQANARVITTANTILDETVNLVR